MLEAMVLRGALQLFSTTFGSLGVFFSNGDPPQQLTNRSSSKGIYSGSWTPTKVPANQARATVGIQARLTDRSTHQIVWADSYSYEGLDLPTALGAVVGTLTRSLRRAFPQMHKAKPS